jgi:spore coat polysaccharide biosynthesis predicted glycosyltransferase SpsG
MTVKHWNTGASAIRFRDQADKQKKDWKVTLSYNIRHNDTYLISNETKEDAIYIAENQNASPKYDCTLIKEDESDIEDEETSIKEVVFNAEKKKWLDKNEK